jgi:hypothetical protein
LGGCYHVYANRKVSQQSLKKLKCFGFLPGFPEVDGNRMEKVRRYHTVVISKRPLRHKERKKARKALSCGVQV